MLLYYVWFFATFLAVVCAWWGFYLLHKRDSYQRSVLLIAEAPLETDEFAGQAQLLCEASLEQAGATGCTLFLQPGSDESGFRQAAQAGIPTDETGPGVVKDLLNRAWETGEIAESQSAGRWFFAFPVWPGHDGGGALVVTWNGSSRPSEGERTLMSSASTVASLIAPRFTREGALMKAREEIQNLRGEVAEESHLAGVGRLATGVAHELSSPLAAVLTMVGSLSRTMQDPVGSRRLQIIQDAVEKCKGIIEKLLVFSKVPLEDSGNTSFSRFVRASTDLNRVIDSTVEVLRESFEQANVVVNTDLDKLPEVRANSTQWSQLFANLLTFAKDGLLAAQSSSPRITIKTRDLEDKIRVDIIDNGPGIPPEEQAHLFEPFYGHQGSNLGSGLGMVQVREVVRKHKGTIEVSSEPGAGTTFIIKIPLEESEQKRES